jgi:hypothetical protein
VIHDGLYKPWSNKLLAEFSDDYKIEEEEEDKNTTSSSADEELIKVTGPYN